MAKTQPLEKRLPATSKVRCPILTVAQQKGGVGKTTWTRVFAEYFSMVRGVRVLAIDLDPQCNLSQRFLRMEHDPINQSGVLPPVHEEFQPNDPEMKGWDGRSGIACIYTGDPILVYSTHLPNVDILPGHAALLQEVVKEKPEDLTKKIVERLRTFLRAEDVQEAYGLIIIDTPPSRNPLTESALRASTDVIMPMEPEVQAQEGLVHMLSFWREELRRRMPDDPLNLVGVLPNKVRRVALHQGILEAMRSDPVIAKHVLPFEAALRVAYSESDHAEAIPKSILQLPKSDEARREAELICRHVEGEVFGNVTE